MTASVALRPVLDSEQGQALALWQSVFGEMPGYFERYFQPDADPLYREGDTLGAWQDVRLVSAVHLCRRPVIWGEATLLCGGIANVATLPEARRQGLSRRLLEMAIAKMEQEGFDYSLLGTGVPDHYAALGWEQTHAPRASVRLNSNAPASEGEWQQFETADGLPALYARAPRPLQFVRDPTYFEGWVAWNSRRWPSSLCRMANRGYLVLTVPEDKDALIFSPEWRAEDAATEQALLLAAVAEVRRHGRDQLGLEALPQHLDREFLQSLGSVTAHTDTGGMARNIRLPAEHYQQIMQEYRTGEAVWWSADGF